MNKIECIQNLFAAYGRADMHTVLAAMDDNIKWIEPGDPAAIPFSGIFNGKTEVIGMFGIEHNLLKLTSFNPTTFYENNDSVVVLGNDSAIVLATQKSYTTEWTMVFTFSAGLISRVQVYMDTLAIARAFKPDVVAAS